MVRRPCASSDLRRRDDLRRVEAVPLMISRVIFTPTISRAARPACRDTIAPCAAAPTCTQLGVCARGEQSARVSVSVKTF